MPKVIPGMNVKAALKVVDKRGFLVRENGRETQKYRLRPLAGDMHQIATYRISGAILAGE